MWSECSTHNSLASGHAGWLSCELKPLKVLRFTSGSLMLLFTSRVCVFRVLEKVVLNLVGKKSLILCFSKLRKRKITHSKFSYLPGTDKTILLIKLLSCPYICILAKPLGVVRQPFQGLLLQNSNILGNYIFLVF